MRLSWTIVGGARKQSRRVSLWVRLAAGTAAVAAVLAAVCILLYVTPVTDSPARADAILVLGPPLEPRIQTAYRLAEAGVSDKVFVSVPSDRVPSSDKLAFCPAPPKDIEVACFVPSPFTTKGEARYAQEMYDRGQLSTVVVVTQAPHVLRARLIFSRCFAGRAEFVADDSQRSLLAWIYEFAYQTAAMVPAFFEPCTS
jgi:uncharacterized SAM-binding protein YcdF (DUF218 family)